MPLPLVWLDGKLLPLAEARISPLDRGFLFGDGAYEVLPVYDGRAYRFEAHMARLDRSLAEIRMAPPLDRAGWLAAFGRLVHGNGGGDQLLYVQVTRGVEPRTQPRTDAGHAADDLREASKSSRGVGDSHRKGVAAVSAEDIRWSRCDIKSTSLLGNVLLRSGSRRTPARRETHPASRRNALTEGSASSAHVVRTGASSLRRRRMRSCRAPRVVSSSSSPVGKEFLPSGARRGERIALGG
jgi:D-alanine transaminase